MGMTDLDARVLISMLLNARSAWRIWDFSIAAYGDDYSKASEGRQAYLHGKFLTFQRSPLIAFSSLDTSNQNRFIRYLRATKGHRSRE